MLRRIAILIVALTVAYTALAQQERSIILYPESFHSVQTDALSGVNIDPIAVDLSRNACARVKIKFDRMTREQVEALEVKFISNTGLAKQRVAQYYDNVLILEMTAKANTRFYLSHPDFGQSNEVTVNLEGNCEYQMLASLNQTFSIVIKSNAVGASVYLDNGFKGQTNDELKITIPNVLLGKHTLLVESGKISKTVDIDVRVDNIDFSCNLPIEAEKYPVSFVLTPKNAIVDIDGVEQKTSDGGLCKIELEKGTYNYKVWTDKYHSKSGELTVDGPKSMSVVLSPKFATVTLTAKPDEQIYVNDELMGIERWHGELEYGTYSVRVSKKDYVDVFQTLTISSNSPENISLLSPKKFSNAQKMKNREKFFGYQGYLEAGPLWLGGGYDVKVGVFTALNIGFTSNHFYGGLEVGLFYDSYCPIMPVGLNFKGYFTKTKVRPYLNMSLGLNYDVDCAELYGFYFRVGGGVDIKRFNIGVNYIPFDGCNMFCASVGVRFGGKKYW